MHGLFHSLYHWLILYLGSCNRSLLEQALVWLHHSMLFLLVIICLVYAPLLDCLGKDLLKASSLVEIRLDRPPTSMELDWLAFLISSF